jgi:hypothetical protein
MLHDTLIAPFALQLRCCVRGNLPRSRMFYKVILHLVITSVFKMRLINRSISLGDPPRPQPFSRAHGSTPVACGV